MAISRFFTKRISARLVVLVGELAAGGREQQERQDEQRADHQAGQRRRQPAHLQLVGDHHGEGELEQVVVGRAGELGPEEGREAALAQQRELVGMRRRAGGRATASSAMAVFMFFLLVQARLGARVAAILPPRVRAAERCISGQRRQRSDRVLERVAGHNSPPAANSAWSSTSSSLASAYAAMHQAPANRQCGGPRQRRWPAPPAAQRHTAELHHRPRHHVAGRNQAARSGAPAPSARMRVAAPARALMRVGATAPVAPAKATAIAARSIARPTSRAPGGTRRNRRRSEAGPRRRAGRSRVACGERAWRHVRLEEESQRAGA